MPLSCGALASATGQRPSSSTGVCRPRILLEEHRDFASVAEANFQPCPRCSPDSTIVSQKHRWLPSAPHALALNGNDFHAPYGEPVRTVQSEESPILSPSRFWAAKRFRRPPSVRFRAPPGVRRHLQASAAESAFPRCQGRPPEVEHRVLHHLPRPSPDLRFPCQAKAPKPEDRPTTLHDVKRSMPET